MRRIISLASLLASALVVAALIAPTTKADSTACGVWTKIPSAGGNVRLFGVAAVSATDVWATGHKANFGLKVIMEHWNGTQWSAVATPATSTSVGLNSLDAVSTSDVWAVGYKSIATRGVPVQTFVEHWDGSQWSIVPSTDPSGTRSNSLIGISHASASDVWAVGYSMVGFAHRTLVEHWDGSAWSVVPSPDPSKFDVLLDVKAIASDDVWAVGYRNDGYGYSTLIEHWDGSSWSAVPSDNPGQVENVLLGISAVSPTDVSAVGYDGNGGSFTTLIEHWDGTSWTTVPSPNNGTEANLLQGASFDSPTDGWAVGASYIGDSGWDSLIEHWDGTSWSIVPNPVQGGTKNRLWAVSDVPGASGTAWAVGSTDKSGTTDFFCPSTSGPTPTVPASQTNWPTGVTQVRKWTPRPTDRASTLASEPDVTHGSRTPQLAAQQVTAVDEASSAGIAQTNLSFGAAVADYNNDGWPDFVYGRHFHPAGLYTSNADPPLPTFTQSFVFPTVDRHACSWGDVNGDGLLDLFCATGGDFGTDIHSNELWIQQPDHTFVNEAGEYNIIDPTSRGRRGVFVDVNHDGWPDLWLGNVAERPDGLPSPNRLMINQGGTDFANAPQYGLDLETNGGCGEAFDYNNDGYQDMLTCSGTGLSFYRNDGGTSLTNVTASLGLPKTATSARMDDLNGDGLLDFVGLQPGVLSVYLQQSDGTFVRVFQQTGLTSDTTVTTGDVNGDNRPDIYVVGGTAGGANAADMLLLNDGTGTNFTQMAIPETALGQGDTAYPIDYDNNGLMDFLVTNGGCTHCQGPLQLIAFFPATP